MSVLINDGNTNDDSILRCDIGKLVQSVELLKTQISPFLKIFNRLRSLLRWEKPFFSFLVMLLSAYIALLNPVHLLVLLLSLALPLMLYGLVQGLGKANKPIKCYQDFFVRKDDGYIQEVLSQEERQKHLKMYLDLLVESQKICQQTNKNFDLFYSVIFWRHKDKSLKYLCMSLGLVVLVHNAEIGKVLCGFILTVFLYNKFLWKEIGNNFRRVRTSIANFFTVKSNFNKSQYIDEGTEQVDSISKKQINYEKIAGEEDEPVSSSESDSEDDDNEFEEDDNREIKNLPNEAQRQIMGNESTMSKWFSARSWRKRTTQHCSLCDQTISSILKKRRYCRHCGKSFCSKCCNARVTRALLGATAPAAYQEKVLVCKSCLTFLNNRSNSATEI